MQWRQSLYHDYAALRETLLRVLQSRRRNGCFFFQGLTFVHAVNLTVSRASAINGGSGVAHAPESAQGDFPMLLARCVDRCCPARGLPAHALPARAACTKPPPGRGRTLR